ncbi:hypothetical protein GCM10018987_52820 [Streptomyces cremeus]
MATRMPSSRAATSWRSLSRTESATSAVTDSILLGMHPAFRQVPAEGTLRHEGDVQMGEAVVEEGVSAARAENDEIVVATCHR